MLLHSIEKSAIKPIFSPPPHPSFFAPKSPFFLPFPVSNPISGDFSRNRSHFLPCVVLFFLALPRFEPDFGRFFDGPLLFSAPELTSSLLFPVLPQTSGTSSRDLTLYFLLTPHFAQREGFSDSVFPFLHHLPHLHISIHFLSAPHSPHPLRPLPTFSCIPPHFSPLSPINKRTRAPSRITRVHVRAHTPARQEVFVFSLHPFTHLLQSTVHQCIRCEGKQGKAFTYRTTNSLSIN